MSVRSKITKAIHKGFAIAATSIVSAAALGQNAQSLENAQVVTATDESYPFNLSQIDASADLDPVLEPVAVTPELVRLPPSDADRIKSADCENLANPPGNNHVAVIINVTTGKMLSDKCDNIDAQWVPASLTKLMSIYTAFEMMKESNGAITGSTTFRISKDVANEKSIMKVGYAKGEKVSVKSLITAMMVLSANDSAKALAQGFSGSEKAFAEQMNLTAQKLGMKNSYFVNASGWPVPDQTQVTTARDMALLANAISSNYPEYADWIEAEQASHKKKVFYPHDHIRNDASVKAQSELGLDVNIAKTGFVNDSKYNILTQALAQTQKWIAVVLGADGDEQRVQTTKMLFKEAIGSWTFGMRDVIELGTTGQKATRPPAKKAKRQTAASAAPRTG